MGNVRTLDYKMKVVCIYMKYVPLNTFTCVNLISQVTYHEWGATLHYTCLMGGT